MTHTPRNRHAASAISCLTSLRVQYVLTTHTRTFLRSVYKMGNTDMFIEYVRVASLVLLRIGSESLASTASFHARNAFMAAWFSSSSGAATRGKLGQFIGV